MNALQSVSRWLAIPATVLSVVALWRSESRATAQTPTARAEFSVTAPAAPPQPTPIAPPAAPAPLAASAPMTAPVATPTAVPHGQLRVRRLVVARDVRDRTPIEPGTEFHLADDPRLFAFVEFDNGTGVDEPVVITFEHGDGDVHAGRVELSIPAERRWRTWGFTRRVRTAGHWVAIVRTTGGRELARTAFDVVA